MIILGLGIFTSREFLAISFDASGATTGALTVPFILALALGVSHLKKDSRASEKTVSVWSVSRLPVLLWLSWL